jgi:signal transduction histidine kinase
MTGKVSKGTLGVEGIAAGRRMLRTTFSAPPPRLVASLSEVASIVSSRSSPQEVLQCVVDEAKVLLRCRKALLVLFGSAPGDAGGGAPAVVIVRGSRDQYPEEWWRSCLTNVAAEVCATDTARVVQDRKCDATLACVPIRARDRVIGLLSAINSRARSFSEEQITLLAVLGAFAGASIENARLREQSECALLAGERNRIAKEMHDGLAQSLFSAALSMEVCKRRLRTAPGDVEEKLGETQQLLSESITELRRYIYDLRPLSLERLGLAGALRSKVDEVVRGSRLTAEFRASGHQRPLPPSAETCLYRVTQEAVANTMKHANAASVIVSLTYTDEGVELVVQDDGQGFDLEQAAALAEAGRSLGLCSMRDRIAAEDGQLRIQAKPATGTRVRVNLPC